MSLNEKKISIFSHGIAALLAVALMIIASFYDLKINHALSDADSVYGLLFVTLAEVPAYIIMPLCGVIFFYSDIEFKNGKTALAVKISSAILTYLGFFVWGAMGSRIAEIPRVYELSALYAALLTVIALFIGKYLRINYSKYVKFAIFALAVMLISFIVIRIFKIFWGRMRYRDMLAINDFSGFTPWYQPNGYNGHNSFPSGHSASACNIFVFVVLFNGKKRYAANFLCILFVVLSMFSRIVINAHFLSDVVAGAAISYICYYAARIIMSKSSPIIEETLPCETEEGET